MSKTISSAILSLSFIVLAPRQSAAAELACVTAYSAVVACTSQDEAFELATLETEDLGDYTRAARSAIEQKRCVVIRPGDEVFVRDYSRDYKQALIRPRGDRLSYWIRSIATHEGSCDKYFTFVGENQAPSRKASTKIEISNEPVKPSKPPCVYKSVMTQQDIAACRDNN